MTVRKSRYWFSFLSLVLVAGMVQAQTIITVDSIHGVFSPRIVFRSVDVEQCQTFWIEEEGTINSAFDIFVRSDGRQFGGGILGGFLDTVVFRNGIPGTGTFIPDYITIDRDKQGWTCDENGYSYSAGKGITKNITGFWLGSDENYLGDLPPNMQCQGGLTYRLGKFYLHSINNQLVEVDINTPSNSKVVMDFPPGILPIDALTTVQTGCDSVITYAIGRTPNNSKIYEINFNDWTLSELCDLPISITGAGSQTECMLPPCDIFLDLDDDNSSFAFRGDYCADTFCVPPVAVADTDVVIISAFNTVESITLELTGWLDTGSEYLSAGPANNINILGNNTTQLTLENNGNASITDFENAISAVMFHNDASTVTYGVRKVLATAFAGGETSLVSTTMLPLSNEQLINDVSITDPTCNGFFDGSISVFSEGGLEPYNYQWEIPQTGDFIENLGTGTYPFLTIDSDGCIRPDTVVLEEPDILIADILYTGPPAICDDSGQLAAVAMGGTGVLAYSWSNGAADSLNTNIVAGSYTLTVEDANACLASASVDIPAGDTVLVVQNDSICTGETFFWNGAEYAEDTLVCQAFSLPGGCDSTVCLSLTVNPLPSVSIAQDGDLCDQNTVVLSAGPYATYAWSTNESTPEITVASAGIYDVTVSDIFGCQYSASVTVLPPVSFDVFFESPSCPGIENGVIDVVNAPGGAVDLLYSIDGSDQFFPDGRFDDLAPGDYLLVVEGANGCTEEVPISLDEPAPITLDAGSDQTIALGESIILDATTNLVGPIVSWSPPDHLDCPDCLTTNARPPESIQYMVEVMDSDGCFARDTVNITVGELLSNVYPPTAFSPNGDGINDYFTIYTDQSVTEVISLKVFDRWGGLVFDKGNFPPNEVGQGWDGLSKDKPAPSGIYVFLAELLKIDGNVELVSGEVNLTR